MLECEMIHNYCRSVDIPSLIAVKVGNFSPEYHPQLNQLL